MTNDEIKRLLDDKGIAYPKSAKKSELEGLLTSCEGDAPAGLDGEADGNAADRTEADSFFVEVTTPLLNVRRAPDLSSEVDRTVGKGEKLEAVETASGWIELSDGCFVMEAFVERYGIGHPVE